DSYELCYILPGKNKILEENWIDWGRLHDSLNTGLDFVSFVGTVGYEDPFYLGVMYAKDSSAMKEGLKKLWGEGKAKASALLEKEKPLYRKIEILHGWYQKDLSYWP
ncbi:MAG: hypothetical protein KGY70_20760, partial [Bacteroidales bacterium]|nr:hypothetical protein [Bacteroidales bacterium]